MKKTLGNLEWGLKHLAKDTKISVSRLKKLLSGDRQTDEEIEKLARCLVKLDGLAFEREESTDMRIAEELKQRQHKSIMFLRHNQTSLHLLTPQTLLY